MFMMDLPCCICTTSSLFSTYLWYSYPGGKCRLNYTGLSFRKVAYMRNDVTWFVGYIGVDEVCLTVIHI
jgi:hypothetical protein